MYCEVAGGYKLFYSEQGNPNGKPIIFVNGLSQSTLIWTATASMLEKDYRIILFDLIFQGQSDKTAEGHTISDHADDLIALMDHLKLDSANLAGISYGSIVSQNVMVRYPDRLKKVVLLSSYDRTTARFREIDQLLSSAMKLGGLAHMTDALYPLALGPDFFENPPMPLPQMKALGLQVNDAASITKLMVGIIAEPDHIEELKQTRIPTLVIHGGMDFLCLPGPAKSLAGHIPDSRFEMIEGVGHTLNVEAVPQIVELIKGFI